MAVSFAKYKLMEGLQKATEHLAVEYLEEIEALRNTNHLLEACIDRLDYGIDNLVKNYCATDPTELIFLIEKLREDQMYVKRILKRE